MAERKMTPQERYDKNNCTRVQLKLNNEYDKDILDYLAASGNKQGTIKKAVRELMEREKAEI